MTGEVKQLLDFSAISFNNNKVLIQSKQVLNSLEFFSNAQGMPLPSLIAIYGNQEHSNNRALSGTSVGRKDTIEF